MLRVTNLNGFNARAATHQDDPTITSELALFYDIGRSACYPGSGQSISDLSGAGLDAWLGADSLVAADDPSFVGTPNGMSINEALDWGIASQQQCRLKTHPTWLNNVNLGGSAEFTIIILVSGILSSTGSSIYFGVGNTGGTSQFYFSKDVSHNLFSTISGVTGTTLDYTNLVIPTASSPGAKAFIAAGHSEALSLRAHYVNGTYSSVTSDITGVRSGIPNAASIGNIISGSTSELVRYFHIILGYSRLLSKSELDILFAQYRGTLGI